jgi:hypothetical protein
MIEPSECIRREAQWQRRNLRWLEQSKPDDALKRLVMTTLFPHRHQRAGGIIRLGPV